MTDLIAELAEVVHPRYDAPLAEKFLRTHHAEIEAMARENEALRLECNFEREKFNRAVKVLSGIYAVIYPRIFDVNGKRYAFHSPIIHEQMQAFSDRIRAIPDEIAAMRDSTREGGE